MPQPTEITQFIFGRSLSRQRNDSVGLIFGHTSSARNLMFAGRFALSRSHLEAALSLYDPISDRSLVHQTGFEPHVSAHALLGNVLCCLGFPDQALAQSKAECVGGSELDDQFELDWCLDWQLARLCATQDAVNIDRYSAGQLSTWSFP